MSSRWDEAQPRRQERDAAEQPAKSKPNGRGFALIAGGVLVAVVLVAVIVLVPAGGGSGDSAAMSAPRASPPPSGAQLNSLPKPIADNVAQANQLVDTSIDAKLASLRGVPVVVNQWASWCPNCRAEFPLFERLAKRYRHQVAFLGVDSQDSRGDAQDFLERFRVDYPSIFDQSAAQAQSIGAGQAWPTTLFFDASGHLRHLRPGGYATLASLDADIRRYALPG